MKRNIKEDGYIKENKYFIKSEDRNKLEKRKKYKSDVALNEGRMWEKMKEKTVKREKQDGGKLIRLKETKTITKNAWKEKYKETKEDMKINIR